MWSKGVESVAKKRERVAFSQSCSNRSKQGEPRANAMGHLGFTHTSSQTHYSPLTSNAHCHVLTSCYENRMPHIGWLSLHSKIMQSFHNWASVVMKDPTVSSGTSTRNVKMGVGGWSEDYILPFHIAPEQPGAQPVFPSPFVFHSDLLLCFPCAYFFFQPIRFKETDTGKVALLSFPWHSRPDLNIWHRLLFSSYDEILSRTFSPSSSARSLTLGASSSKNPDDPGHVVGEREASSHRAICGEKATLHPSWRGHLPLWLVLLCSSGKSGTPAPREGEDEEAFHEEGVCTLGVCAFTWVCVSLSLRVVGDVEGELRFIYVKAPGSRVLNISAGSLVSHEISSTSLELTGTGRVLVLPQPSPLGNPRAGLSLPHRWVASSVGPKVPFLKRKVHAVGKRTDHGFLFPMFCIFGGVGGGHV